MQSRSRLCWTLCGACPADEFECAALQTVKDDMPTLFQGVHSMRCFMWHDNVVLMSRIVRDAMRMGIATSSGDELGVY